MYRCKCECFSVTVFGIWILVPVSAQIIPSRGIPVSCGTPNIQWQCMYHEMNQLIYSQWQCMYQKWISWYIHSGSVCIMKWISWYIQWQCMYHEINQLIYSQWQCMYHEMNQLIYSVAVYVSWNQSVDIFTVAVYVSWNQSVVQWVNNRIIKFVYQFELKGQHLYSNASLARYSHN